MLLTSGVITPTTERESVMQYSIFCGETKAFSLPLSMVLSCRLIPGSHPKGY
jgi:hypothetical protein